MKDLKDKKLKRIKMSLTKVTKAKFLKHLNEGNTAYMKKQRSWQKISFYWECEEQWFMNQVYDKRENGKVIPDPKGVWIIAKDLPHHIDHLERQGYNYYIDKENE